MLLPFYGVGMTTQDQLVFSLGGLGDFWTTVIEHAEKQGRIYFLFTKSIDLWLASHPELFSRKLITLLVFAATPVCFAYTIFRSRANRLIFTVSFTALAWIGFEHTPPAAYPVVNHLPFLLWPLLAFWLNKEKSWSTGLGWKAPIFGALSYFCFFQYEPVTLMSFVVLAWVIYRSSLNQRSKRTLGFWLVIAFFTYAVSYVIWLKMHPSKYPGTEFGELSIGEFFHVTVAYTLGGLPYTRIYDAGIFIQRGGILPEKELLLFIRNSEKHFEIGNALTVIFAMIALAFVFPKKKQPVDSQNRNIPWYSYVVLIASLVIAINGPLGLSEKYQGWVRLWFETYLTSQLSLYASCIAVTLCAACLIKNLHYKKIPIGLILCLYFAGNSAYSVRMHNNQVAIYQRANLSRWDAAAAIASSSELWSETVIVAPDLYYSIFSGEPDWEKYWSSYFKGRFDLDLEIKGTHPEGNADETYALSRILLDDDGFFQAVTIQTNSATYIVCKEVNLPTFIGTENGDIIAPEWWLQKHEIRGEFWIYKIEGPEEWIGLDKIIHPSWIFPRSGAKFTQRVVSATSDSETDLIK